MVCVLASSVVDRGFESRSGQIKDYKTGWLGIRIMCRNGQTCPTVDCRFSELAL
jgi:hypothetical protein